MLTRKQFLRSILVSGAGTALPLQALAGGQESDQISLDDLKAMEKLMGVSFTDEERKAILSEVRSKRAGYESVRKLGIDYRNEPRTIFSPIGELKTGGSRAVSRKYQLDAANMSEDDIAFSSVAALGQMIKAGKLSPVRLTEIYLDRLKRYGDKLLCVVNLTEERAKKEAAAAEREIRAGHYRGPLHGIPFGIKDLFAAAGYPTTWGANVFEHRIFDYDASVLHRLNEAGAILVAKLSNGTFALGDVWFKGTTKNPFNLTQGSSGSSAGSASATAAGLVAFAIGTETLGSIMSPSTRCRVTGLRPTYGRVSRYGGMALSYTMDKVGPICRSVEDCALVFSQINGSDPEDPSAVSSAFNYGPVKSLKGISVGYPVGASADLNDLSRIDRDPALAALKKLGANVKPAKFSNVPNGVLEILDVESASAFDEFTRSEDIRHLNTSPWPNTFRAARYVPAVEYLQAQRARAKMMEQFEKERASFDLIVAGGIGGVLLQITNLTGTPQVCIPWGADASNNSIAVSLIGRNYEDDKLCQVADLLQQTAEFHHLRPNLSSL